MRPYTRRTNKGRTIARDDIHHATADQSRQSAQTCAKAARHGARQEGRQARFEIVRCADKDVS